MGLAVDKHSQDNSQKFSAFTLLDTGMCTGQSCCPIKGYGECDWPISYEVGIKNLSHFLLFRLLTLRFRIPAKTLCQTAFMAVAQLHWLCLIQEGSDSCWSSYQRQCWYAQEVLQKSSFLLLAVNYVINSKQLGFEVR